MSTTTPDARLIRQARLAEALTVAWMVVELVVALWAGIVARSVALTTFGVDSGIELFTAAVVLRSQQGWRRVLVRAECDPESCDYGLRVQ